MHFLLHLLLLTTVASSVRSSIIPKSNIINGHPAGKIVTKNGETFMINNGEYPYLATLHYKDDNEIICGGVIYKPNVILTAAHCIKHLVKKASLLYVRAGSFEMKQTSNPQVQITHIKTIIKHPEHNLSKTNGHDIAVIHLSKPFVFNKYVNSIKLATTKQDGTFSDEIAVVVGFGQTENCVLSDNLAMAKMRVRSFRTCKTIIDYFDPSMLCLYGPHKQSVCYGDSGGPIVKYHLNNPSRALLIGIVSFSFNTDSVNAETTDCDPEYPSVAANVAYLRSWIDHWANKAK